MKRGVLVLSIALSLVGAEAQIVFTLGPNPDDTGGLREDNEVPAALFSPARGGSGDFGIPEITYDSGTRTLSFNAGFGQWGVGYAADLSGNYLNGGIYEGSQSAASVTAPLVHQFTTGADGEVALQPGNPSGLSSSGTIEGSVVLTPAQESLLLANSLFVNLFSDANPTFSSVGEIRGQLLAPVPEPQTCALLSGLALIGFAAYRRVKAVFAATKR
ncbi:MAG TPA: CHRD domain-containing protein [Verrucomicrobiae bacterium]|jgi:hypothetical protein|nr:CHRD domain-containing protein [Verrucomicrobiae bacterium]